MQAIPLATLMLRCGTTGRGMHGGAETLNTAAVSKEASPCLLRPRLRTNKLRTT